jgi:hypothetical protein
MAEMAEMADDHQPYFPVYAFVPLYQYHTSFVATPTLFHGAFC